MIVNIIDDYYIDTTDTMNVQAYVDKGRDKAGKVIKDSIGYHRTFKQALECIYHHRELTIGGDREVELAEALEILRQNHAEFIRKLEEEVEEV